MSSTIEKPYSTYSHKIAEEIAGGIDTGKKAVQLGKSGIDITNMALGQFAVTPVVAEKLQGIANACDGFCALSDVMGLASGIAELADAEKMKKWKKASPEKIVQRSILLIPRALKAVAIVDKFAAGFLNQPELCIEGKIPYIRVATDGLFVAASVVGIVAAGRELHKANKSIADATSQKGKWEARFQELYAPLDGFDVNAVQAKYQAKLQSAQDDKVKGRYQDYLQSFTQMDDTNYSQCVEEFRKKKLQVLVEKYENKIAAGNPDAVKLEIDRLRGEIDNYKNQLPSANSAKERKELNKKIADDERSLAQYQQQQALLDKRGVYVQALQNGHGNKFINYKIEVAEISVANGSNLRKKSWISIAAEVLKIAAIVLANAVIGLALLFPQLNHVAVKLSAALFGALTNIFQLTKSVYGNVVYPSKLLQKKPFELPPQQLVKA